MVLRTGWLILWFTIVSIPLTYAAGLHHAVLPNTSGAVVHAVGTASSVNWRMTHVLVAGCPCSQTVADYLVRRGASTDLNEDVILLGNEDVKLLTALRDRGFHAIAMTFETAEQKFGISGGPSLQIENQQGMTVYSGGYASRRPRDGEKLEDLVLLERCRAGESVSAYPLYGCATSRKVQRAIDPLGLKYGM